MDLIKHNKTKQRKIQIKDYKLPPKAQLNYIFELSFSVPKQFFLRKSDFRGLFIGYT